MIRLGTVAPIGFDDFDPGEWLACYREMGCQVVQAYRNQSRAVSLAQIQEGIAAGGLPCDSLHGIFGEEFDPSAPDETHRCFAVESHKREGELCQRLGGKLVVVHCATIRAHGVSAAERAQRVAQLKKSIEALGRFGADNDMIYAFENLPGYHAIGYDVAELAGILRDVAAPNTGMCFDSGHANMVCDPVAAVAQTAGQMIYAHISDNNGQADEHEMITCGSIDAEGLARALRGVGYDGTFMLEVFYPLQRLRALLAEGIADRLARILRIANGRDD
jgi:sugar phosphate isomerase/epimerase